VKTFCEANYRSVEPALRQNPPIHPFGLGGFCFDNDAILVCNIDCPRLHQSPVAFRWNCNLL